MRIRDDQEKLLAGQQFQGQFGALDRLGFIALVGQNRVQRKTHIAFVIHHQNWRKCGTHESNFIKVLVENFSMTSTYIPSTIFSTFSAVLGESRQKFCYPRGGKGAQKNTARQE